MAVQLNYLEERLHAVEGMVAFGTLPNIIVSRAISFTSTIENDPNGLQLKDKLVKPGTIVGVPYGSGSRPEGLDPSRICEPLYRNNPTQSPVHILGVSTNAKVDRSASLLPNGADNTEGKEIGVLVQGYIWVKPETEIIAYSPMWSRYRVDVVGGVATGDLGKVRATRVEDQTLRSFNIVPMLNSKVGELNLVQVSLFDQSSLFRDVNNVIPYPLEVPD